jgi:hypothetical protein
MKSKKRDILLREGQVLDWELHVYARAEGTKQSRHRDSSQYLILEGEFTEPVNGVAKFSLQLHADAEPGVGARDMPCVGSVLRVKPEIQAGATLTPEEFQSILLLASTGNLKYLAMYFQQPRYGSALIANLSFSSRMPQPE